MTTIFKCIYVKYNSLHIVNQEMFQYPVRSCAQTLPYQFMEKNLLFY